MKKSFIIGCLLMFVLAIGVSAADDIILSAASISAEEKPTKGFSTSFSVTNNGTTSLTGVTVSLSTTELTNFNVSFSPSSFDLANGSSQAVTVTGNIPEDVNTRLSPFSGTISVTGGTDSETINLDVTAKSQLELDDFKVEVDGDSDSIDNGDSIKDVLPGSKVEFKGDIENIFTDDEDISIEDVEIEIIIEGIDDDDELEETEDVGDIDADDQEGFSIEFEIPKDVDDGDYDVVITVDGEDENGAKHAVEWELTLKLEKDKHDVWITKASVSPSKVSCSRNIRIETELKNQGTSDEDEVVLNIESSALDIDFEDRSIPELEEGAYDDDTEYSKSYSFSIADSVKAGTYGITLKAYYDTDTLSDTETIDVTVEKCSVVDEEEEEEEEDVIIVSPPSDDEEDEPEIITTPITETTEGSLLSSNAYLLLLIGAIGVVAIVIIVIVVLLLGMKKKV